MKTRVLFLFGFFASIVSAANWRVSPGESVLARALAGASAGDVVILSPGIYREAIRIEKSITLRGEKGVILDGTKTLEAKWQPAPNMGGVFVAAAVVVVEGLTLRGGAEAVSFMEGAQDDMVRGCKVTSYEGTGIAITGGASRCTVDDCVITRGAFEEWRPTSENRRENYEIWRIHKDVNRSTYRKGKPLPGCEDGSTKGNAPDVGAEDR
jgi:nitrous oxidase accessory protein NosD